MEPLRRLVQAVDNFQQRHRWLAFPFAVVKKFGDDQAGRHAAPAGLLRVLLAVPAAAGGGDGDRVHPPGPQGSHLRGSGLAGVAASAVVNTLLFLVGFRVLTVRNVPLRSLLPGAVLAALAWALLQWLGAWYVGRKLTRATNT